MELMILKSVNNDLKEAFIKLEDGCRLTVAFTAPKGKYMFVSENCTEFPKNRPMLRFNESHIPKNCGIFLIDEDNAYPMCFLGNADTVKRQLEKSTGLNILDKKAVEEEVKVSVEEIPPNSTDIEENKSSDEEPEYKRTGYTLPEDFLAPPEKTPDTFWDCNEEKFNEIFSQNPENEILSSLIPGSKWVNAEDCVMGIIYDEDNSPMYICYGFPLPWSEEPPQKLEGYCQWIPLDCAQPHDEGFWVIYINAKTGERIR